MPGSDKTILLIDDDPFLAEMYSLKFQESGFLVKTASDGQQAIDQLESGLIPDIILLDVVMPHLDGFEVLKVIKSKEKLKLIPVVLLTNVGQKEDVERGISLGADDYIVKAHFTPSEVVARISTLLDHRKSIGGA